MDNKIVDRINDLREKKGWSQYELAKLTGISLNAVYAWNRTGAIPSLSNIELICQAADITIEQFFYDMNSLSDEENKLLSDWVVLSDLEKDAIFSMIEVFKTLRK